MTKFAKQRFYAAKSEPITAVEPLVSATIEGGELMLARVHRPSGSDVYQLLLDAHGNDVLATHSAPLLAAWAAGRSLGFGQLHDVQGTIPDGEPVALQGEQSNTSLIVDSTIVKFFRRLEPGMNPDVELLLGLSQTDCAHIVPIRAWVGYEDYVLAVAQDFLADAVDAWTLATNTADFTGFAREIGAATRSVHDALASVFPTSMLPATEITARLEDRLEQHIARAPMLEQFADAARALYSRLSGDIEVQRVHGDLHLGQILRSNDTFFLIDFEGEPAISLEQRRELDTPLRDVAGLIRSLDYAGHAAATAALLEGYGISGGNDPVLDCFVLDKALYEVAYELNNRPDWVEIPLRAVRRLVKAR